jgi:hypothetical protein
LPVLRLHWLVYAVGCGGILTRMIGPYVLTRIVYVLLIVAFSGVVVAVVIYNRKVKTRQRELARPGEEFPDTPSRILAATKSLERDAGKR